MAPTPARASGARKPDPLQLIACVASHRIDRGKFAHWERIALALQASEKHKTASAEVSSHLTIKHRHPGSKGIAIREEVMGFLLSSYWVVGEAEALKIEIPQNTVLQQFEKIRREQFPKRGEFKSFLRRSGQSVGDLLFRVRLNLLSAEIQKHVLAGESGASEKEQALREFVTSFEARWRAQTFCRRAFAVPDCGHVQSHL